MIFEITGVERNAVITGEVQSNDHYVMTPYRYTPKAAKKLVPAEFIDLGQGIFEIVSEVYHEIENEIETIIFYVQFIYLDRLYDFFGV